MKNKIAKLCALFIIFAVGFSSLNGIAVAANNQVKPTGDAPDGMINNTPPNFTASSLSIIYVPDDYSTIQAAIDNASDGDTIIVRDGTYTENIVVDKRLTIESENGSDFTLVQAQSSGLHVFNVTADYVNISGFTVKGATYYTSGIYLGRDVDHCNITDNKVLDNDYGIYLYHSNSNTISNNTANSNNYHGISLSSSSNNTISNNTASNNGHGIYLYRSSDNEIYLNNFNNYHNVYSSDSFNIWNSPEKISYGYLGNTHTSYLGNYWDDYTGRDADGDGIGDTPYSNDYYPLKIFADNYILIPVPAPTPAPTSTPAATPAAATPAAATPAPTVTPTPSLVPLIFGSIIVTLFLFIAVILKIRKGGRGIPSKFPTKKLPVELERNYSVAEYIGEGGFAWVFRVTCKDGKKAAVKIPKSSDVKTGKLFIREVSNWINFKHENIVELYDFNIFPIPYLEMELCDGCLECEGISIGKAVSIIFDVAKGLRYAHEKKIIHGDLKTSNILIKDGKFKISDWGLSKVKTEKSVSLSGITPQYAAPEGISRDFGRADERTDIYQLGAVFYELVTGKLPFEGEYADVINHIINDEPVLPSEINPDSKCVEHIIMKCLRKKKEERYQSVDELIKELEDYRPEDETTLINEN